MFLTCVVNGNPTINNKTHTMSMVIGFLRRTIGYLSTTSSTTAVITVSNVTNWLLGRKQKYIVKLSFSGALGVVYKPTILIIKFRGSLQGRHVLGAQLSIKITHLHFTMLFSIVHGRNPLHPVISRVKSHSLWIGGKCL